MKIVKIEKLTPDPRNVNIHSQYGMGLLENSLRFNGFGRSGVLSADNVIIAGNGMTEAAGIIGAEDAIVVDSDGTKPVYIRRTDIRSNTPEFYNMALADNVVAKKNIVLDVEAVEALVEEVPETKFWVDIITEEPKRKSQGDEKRADMVEVVLRLSAGQHATFKKAMKLAKQRFDLAEMDRESDSEQANLLTPILKEFIKTK